MSLLADRIIELVAELSESHVAALAAAIRSVGSSSGSAAVTVRTAVPASHHKPVDKLLAAWKAASPTDGASVALALETALVAQRRAGSSSVEVVVTGPDSPAAPVRLTSEVVQQLIDSARSRVMLISYAAYQMPTIIAALDAAVARGVQVDVILESPENLDGGGGAAAYKKYRVFHWPLDERDPPEAKLHAKAVIVDGRDVLLTSANMSNAAYDKNIELGVLCQGGPTAERVQQHFDALIARGVLVTASKTFGP